MYCRWLYDFYNVSVRERFSHPFKKNTLFFFGTDVGSHYNKTIPEFKEKIIVVLFSLSGLSLKGFSSSTNVGYHNPPLSGPSVLADTCSFLQEM